MKALILSGGTGTRLRPLTYSNAKQLLPVANKPILFYIIEKIVSAGITDIGIIVGDTHKDIEAAVGNGSQWGIDVAYICQPEPLGLAHAVKTAAGFLKDEDFLMILGDNLFQMELGAVIKEFSEKAVNALIVLHESDNPSKYGVAVVDGEHVLQLVEKPKIPPSNLIITGIYLFNHSIFAAIDRTVPSPRGELEITDAIQKLLDMGGSVAYKLTEGWWKDTGSLEDILEANRLVLGKPVSGSMGEQMTQSTISPGCILEGQIQAGSNVSILDSSLKGPIILGSDISIKGCQLGPFIAVGDHAELSGCKIEDSIILEGCIIRNISQTITSSLIGKGSRIEGWGGASEGASGEVPERVPEDKLQKICFFIGNDSKIIQQGEQK
jgi:glucose-1-phosphate thymidylyltransferase